MGKNNKTIIVNMMMMMMIMMIIMMMMMMMTNPEYIATEHLAIAKSSVAISSAHHYDADDKAV